MKKKEKNVMGLQDSNAYQDSVHRIGRIGMILILIYSLVMPFGLAAIYDCFPSILQVLLGAGMIMLAFGSSALVEVFTYTPILGSSSYLTFLTGNISNLKFPCAMNALKIARADQNTEEGDAVTLVAVSVSSIITMIIIAIGAIAMTPLRPLLETDAMVTASDYILPALFGNLIYNFLFKETGTTAVKKKELLIIFPLALIGGLILLGILSVSYVMLLLIVVLPVNIFIAKKLFNKKILTVEKIGGEEKTAETSAAEA